MRKGRSVVGVVAGAAMLLLAGAREAEGYVQYRSSTGVAFAWNPACLPLPIVAYPGTFSQMTIAEITGAVTGATAAWSAGANSCTFFDFDVTVASGPAPRAANDRINVISFRDTSWCKLAATGACDPAVAYDQAALALTSVSASTSTGKIADADIEINAFHFSWADLVPHPELTNSHDLQNALTHEVGHVLGLDHTCFFQGSGATRPNDNAGQPVPDCDTAPASVQATTMFPSANPGDLDKRTLEPDDRAGVCGIYPAAANPCPPGAGCVCPSPGADGGADGGQDAGGSADALPADAPSTDAGKASSGGGCACETGGRSSDRSWPPFAFLAAAFAAATRRRR